MNRLVEIWLLYGAACSAGGWILSWFHFLNPLGYLLLHGGFCAGVAWLYFRKRPSRGFRIRKLRTRFFPGKLSREGFFSFRRLLPFSFLILSGLSLLAGLLYAPNNYDALTYRIPRVLHWLQNEGWHWIHTSCPRMNNRATGFEWLMTPQLSIFGTDRFLFLLNFISFLLLPGLLFSFIRASGGSGRGPWFWMWLWPTGLGYLLQAASIANDAFATVYILAATVSALRFGRIGDSQSLFFCLLATALLSGLKTSNVILSLVPLAILAAAWKRILPRMGMVFASAFILIPASFLPTAFLNWKFCNDWTGAALETSRYASTPWIGWAGNALQLIGNNVAPPLLPNARGWDERLQSYLPDRVREALSQDFEGGFAFGLGEIPTEGSGLGLGLTVALMTVAWMSRRQFSALWERSGEAQRLNFFSGPVALGILMSKSAILTFYRICLPFYPVVFIFFLAATCWGRIRSSSFLRWVVFGQIFLAFQALLLEPSRPLWPAVIFLSQPPPSVSLAPLWQRALSVYRTYGERHAVYSPIRQWLPANTQAVGFFNGGDDPVATLWKPYGTLEVFEITPMDSLANLQQRGIRFAILGERGVRELAQMQLEEWILQSGGRIVSEFMLVPAVSRGQERWVLIELPIPPAK
jgi:hypothetical protein